MVDRPILNTLPECDLIAILTEKASQRNDIRFDFIGKLNDFRERVSGEIRQINILFPEYTPHDEEYHLSRLFHVASQVLGQDKLEAMNSAELFVLAISLYGHDWGMAVNEVEKEFILSNNKSTSPLDPWILPDEKLRLSKFLKNQGLKTNSTENKVSMEVWREYVRQTHAFRSGERVRKYFEQIDGGIADAASRVCEGHWLDFEDLDDYHRYPPDYSVLRESVNLRALAVYLRLIDLLDLSEDRTPYVIWKFVAPRDPRSKMEWAKHRALRPITSPQYQQGRIIQVDGSTDDHEVYAALEDLKLWCEQQLRGCNDILARMNDPRHKLDIYHIDWRVNARGFEPILIQFEFDRERMFEILGDDIYKGDPYVFLRELLQNSIDAIRVRREVLKRNGVEPGDIGGIRVNVEHSQTGDAIITWTDDGIGMDDYIIRNYLAVAGKSYYRSADFEREDLNIDPISKFGIGFLSTFMVADRVEIRTFKDPYLPPASKPLSVSIPAMHRQFRIETYSRESASVGTSIKIFVEGKKLRKKDTDSIDKRLDVTWYLSTIAGFVEFPIIISEDKLNTIIIHPNQNPSKLIKRLDKTYTIKKIDQSFVLSDHILPQDLTVAQGLINEVSFDLSSDLKLAGYEGTISYFLPADKVVDINENNLAYPGANTFVIFLRNGAKVKVRKGSISSIAEKPSQRLPSRSATNRSNSQVYRDGIMLSTASNYRRDGMNPIMDQQAKVIVNLPKLKTDQIDLARTEILNENEHWANPIFQALLKKLNLNDLLKLSPLDRLYKLSWVSMFYNIPVAELWDDFPHENWPIALLKKGGHIIVAEWGDISSQPIKLLPDNLPWSQLLNNMILGLQTRKSILNKWDGESCMIAGYNQVSDGGIIESAHKITKYPIERSYTTSEIRFLTAPYEDLAPLVQEVVTPSDKETDISIDGISMLEQIAKKPLDLNIYDVQAMKESIRSPRNQRRYYQLNNILDYIEKFDSNHKEAFAYGFRYLNIAHPTTQTIIRSFIALELATHRVSINLEKIGQIQDAFFDLTSSQAFPFGNREEHIQYDHVCNKLIKAFSLIKDSRLLDINPEKLIPTSDEFIKGSIFYKNRKLTLIIKEPRLIQNTSKKNVRSFGKSMKSR